MKFPHLLAIAALALGGCSKHDHGSHGSHVHAALHGGTLIEIGDHAYNLELVRDTATGKFTAYVLDSHAENFVRIAAPSLEVVAYSGGERRTLTLLPVANTATGETIGNTSQFEAEADWVKRGGELNGEIAAFEIRGTRFPTTAFNLPK